jgi:hypothetical protein
MKTPTSEQLTSILLAVIALIPSQGIRYTGIGLFAAIILSKTHLKPLLLQFAVSPKHTEEYIHEATVEVPQSYSELGDQRRRLCE